MLVATRMPEMMLRTMNETTRTELSATARACSKRQATRLLRSRLSTAKLRVLPRKPKTHKSPIITVFHMN